MGGVVVAFAQRLEVGRNLLLALDVEGVAEEFTAALLEDGLRVALDGKITILDLLHYGLGLTLAYFGE